MTWRKRQGNPVLFFIVSQFIFMQWRSDYNKIITGAHEAERTRLGIACPFLHVLLIIIIIYFWCLVLAISIRLWLINGHNLIIHLPHLCENLCLLLMLRSTCIHFFNPVFFPNGFCPCFYYMVKLKVLCSFSHSSHYLVLSEKDRQLSRA